MTKQFEYPHRESLVNNFMVAFNLTCADETCRLVHADMIGEFLYSSYFVGFNPLPHLRKLLPTFTWKFFKFKSDCLSEIEDTVRVMRQNHISWLISDITLVTMGRTDEQGQELLWVQAETQKSYRFEKFISPAIITQEVRIINKE